MDNVRPRLLSKDENWIHETCYMEAHTTISKHDSTIVLQNENASIKSRMHFYYHCIICLLFSSCFASCNLGTKRREGFAEFLYHPWLQCILPWTKRKDGYTLPRSVTTCVASTSNMQLCKFLILFHKSIKSILRICRSKTKCVSTACAFCQQLCCMLFLSSSRD